MCHPKQVKVYSCFATKRELQNFERLGMSHIKFSPNKPMGVNTIGDLLKSFAKYAGIVEWNRKTPHCLRQYFITKMANDPSLNLHEIAKLARHKSVSSQEAYVPRTQAAQVATAISLARPGMPSLNSGMTNSLMPQQPGFPGHSLQAAYPPQQFAYPSQQHQFVYHAQQQPFAFPAQQHQFAFQAEQQQHFAYPAQQQPAQQQPWFLPIQPAPTMHGAVEDDRLACSQVEDESFMPDNADEESANMCDVV